MKSLIKKFGYNSLEAECEKQGWRIPTINDLLKADIDYEWVWVNELPELDDNRGYLYNKRAEALVVCNKNHLHQSVVIKIPCEWNGCDDGYYSTSCNKSFIFTESDCEGNDFKYCPYCGREIKEMK